MLFKKSVFKSISQLLLKQYYPFYINQRFAEDNNKFKEFFRQLFGFRFLYFRELYDALSIREIMRRDICLGTSENPLVSIIVPVYNNLSYTFNCLLSIRENVSNAIPFEVIVIDDCSTDCTSDFFKSRTEGIRYIRNVSNQGFLLSCNEAVSRAKGTYICLLNNDTQVRKRWLESLLEVIEKDPEVGCVGSKLIYPNGYLQEAGGIVFSDASGANYGRMDSPEKEKYNYIREVDYCSGASILFRKVDFIKLGFFDERFKPAYYEDTDFCMSVRNILGKKVVYQPFSQVLHYEGITSGKEVVPGTVKFYQEINRQKFYEKWHIELRQHYENGDVDCAARRLLPPSILIIELLPTFDRDSGSLRITRIMRILKSLKFHIIFAPPNVDIREPYYSALLKEGIEVSNDFCALLYKGEYQSDIIECLEYVWLARPDLNDTFQDKLSSFKHIRLIYDTLDLHHIRMQREAELLQNEPLLHKAEEMRQLELRVAQRADITLTVTKVEAEILRSYGIKNTAVVPNIHYPRGFGNRNAYSMRSGLLFIGGYTHPPNIDAVLWLVNEIMPIVWREKPTLKVYLLGSKPTIDVLALANDDVIVPGYIEDVSEYFITSRVFVSPLRYGAGMKGKIGQSMEFGLPVVSTSIGVEGMDLTNDKDVLIADDKIAFANQILRLYDNETLWYNLANASYDSIYKFSPEVIKEDLRKILESVKGAS
ncbi:glycosyltransferase [Desertivirga xinjiangensis]|uniref:glycosyltransferase n=1 Tax=Desertivirga xinjiangensis TaxID=539206 RepID=UPI002108A7ED|nr:glycosyltransferase [Pedobacter xinjiangensis]